MYSEQLFIRWDRNEKKNEEGLLRKRLELSFLLIDCIKLIFSISAPNSIRNLFLQYDKKFQKRITVNENETNFWGHQKKLTENGYHKSMFSHENFSEPNRRMLNHASTHAFTDASISCVDACVGVDSGSATL